MSSFC